jgi:hypothetical protein
MPRHLLSPFMVALLFCLTLEGGAAAAPLRPGIPAGSADDELVRMGREIPGFGGLYFDERGRPNVFLLDPEGPGRAALKSLGAEVVVHRGDYEIERLIDWRLQLRPVLAVPGVVFLDVDERANRVVVGLDATRAKSLDRDRLERRILAAGVPRPAVVLRETAHIEPWTGLQDKVRPAAGGLQIVFSGFACTLGFNAYRDASFGFLIASHCTDVMGEVEGTRFYQSLPGKGNAIGTETADPEFSTDPPCPAGKRCRFSDTAFAKYDNPRLGGLGKIARPVSGGSESGTLTLKPTSARFSITGRAGAPMVGDFVHKVGRTTGWTFGTVIGTCMDVNEDVDVTLFCQSLVQLGGGPGDSGSPVFTVLPGNKARLVGLLWGGGDDPTLGIVGVFSPLENIEEDLGPLRIN